VELTHLDGKPQTQAQPQISAISGGVNMLLVGTDTRSDQGGQFDTAQELAGSSGAGNNDVTILIHIAQNHKSAVVVSYPRDMMVAIPSCPDPSGGSYSAMSDQMLNSSLSYGGLDCPVLTIEQLTGLTIPYAAEITFDGVVAMSNAIGGVSVCVASPIDDPYSGLVLSAGNHVLEGTQALEFLRTRHGIADGSDLGRISSQQVFLSSLVRTIQSGGALKNPLELYKLAKAAVSNMQLSSSLENVNTLVQIALALKNIPTSNVVFVQYPTLTDPTDPDRVIPDPSAGPVLNSALLNDQPVTLTGQTGRGAELAPATSTPSPAAGATPAPSSTPSATPSPSEAGAVSLPSSITGQTAAEQTCSKGNADDE
jgi:LCP family protein required for cell wall assembly